MRIILLAACALSLSGCALLHGGSGDVRLPVGKALLVSELATTGANVAATQAANSNVCHGTCAVTLKDKLDKLNRAVAAAFHAWTIGNTALASSTISDAMTQALEVSQQAKTGGE